MKEERAIIKAAKITAMGAIIVAIISGIFLIISDSNLFSFAREESKGGNALNQGLETTTKDSVNFETYNKVKQTEELLSAELTKDLNYADDLYGLGQFASSYRHYEKLYNSLPDKMKKKVKQADIEKAKEKYRTFKYSEAAYIMKTCLDSLSPKNKK